MRNIHLKNFITLLLSMNRSSKISCFIFFDLICSILSLYISISIINKEFYFNIFEYPVILFLSSFLFIPIFYAMGVYRTLLRYVGLNFFNKIFLSVLIYSIIFYVSNYFIHFFYDNLTITIIQSLIFFIFILNNRVALNLFLHNFIRDSKKKNLIVYGAGEAGFFISQKTLNHNIICFVDDDVNKLNNRINNIPIYNSSKILELIKKYNIDILLIAIPSLNFNQRKKIIDKLENYPIELKIIPKLDDFLTKNLSIDDYNFISTDFVKRNITWNLVKISKSVIGKNILITGAGGSIGSELSRQIFNMEPNVLVILDNNEFNLYKINYEFSKIIQSDKKLSNIKLIPILADICDYNRIDRIFNLYRIDKVFHAASFKHVSLLEINKIASVHNNILGSFNIVKLSNKYKINKLIFISTDKAVKPTSIMGCSKRISEIILLHFAKKIIDINASFSIVRFGNVINSNGSVIPLFNDQIKKGGPITITHPDVTRYFMSIPEAVGLVLETSIIAKNGDKFILNMGEPIKILDIAKKMTKLAGLKNSIDHKDPDINIEFIGLRDGEKLHEDLSLSDEFMNTSNEFIFKDNYVENLEFDMDIMIKETNSLIEKNDDKEIKLFFKKYIKDLSI